MSRQHVNRIIAAGSVNEILEPTGSKPIPERQARTLVPLLDEPELLRETYQAVVASGKPVTAETIRSFVGEVRKVIADDDSLLEMLDRALLEASFKRTPDGNWQ